MMLFRAALWAEALKACRSKVPWLTALGFSLAPKRPAANALTVPQRALVDFFEILHEQFELPPADQERIPARWWLGEPMLRFQMKSIRASAKFSSQVSVPPAPPPSHASRVG